MTEELSRHFAEYIKDHDKRFVAKARPDGADSSVLLTLASDGTTLDPIFEISDYQATQIEQNDPGPTVSLAWEKWQAQVNGG